MSPSNTTLLSLSATEFFLLSLSTAIIVGSAILFWKKRRSKSHKQVGVVSGLFVYPVKSCKGIALAEAECGFSEGIKHDRCVVASRFCHSYRLVKL